MKDVAESRRQKDITKSQPATENNSRFETGQLSKEEIEAILNTIPIDLTYVGKDDALKFYNRSTGSVFPRSPETLGRTVQKCHAEESMPQVEKILDDFKSGRKDDAESWTSRGDRTIHIQYLAVRDRDGKYLGTLEVAQDTTDLKPVKTKGYR